MNRQEAVDLLTLCATFDQRTAGKADVYAWQAVLHDIPFPAAREAVLAFYRDAERRIMPADIREHVKKDSRPESVPFAELPAAEGAEPNPDYLRARDEMTGKWRRRDEEALGGPVFAEQDPGDRAARWINSHAGPSKPAGPPIDVASLDRWVELPGDPPELRAWLAAQRRREHRGRQDRGRQDRGDAA